MGLTVSAPEPPKEVEIPLREDESVHGIIWYLTRKHGGNVHEEGIVTITSKSVVDDDLMNALRNAAALVDDTGFQSKDEPGQWICWDFHKMRVRPTHYTIRSYLLKSWVVESSLDGVNWTEIDRKTDNDHFRVGWSPVSYAVSNSADCRFIRLTQTGKTHGGQDWLCVSAFEVFGTLLE
jgi:hypothetical protein